MRDEWTKRWQVHPHERMYHPYAPTPHKAHLAAHSGRGKALSAVAIQMRTGKIGLYSYLQGIGPDRITTDRCRGCNRHRKILQHVLLDCPSYRENRQKDWSEGTPHSLQEIRTDAQETATAAKLMLSTALLHRFSRVKKGTTAASVRMPSQN
jgi:hypothetical protein